MWACGISLRLDGFQELTSLFKPNLSRVSEDVENGASAEDTDIFQDYAKSDCVPAYNSEAFQQEPETLKSIGNGNVK